MPLIFNNGTLLIRGGRIAMDTNCCCPNVNNPSQCCCPNVLPSIYNTLYARITGGTVSECTPLTYAVGNFCGRWSGTEPDLTACTDTPIPMVLVFECLNRAQGCNGYRLTAGFNNSGCKNIAAIQVSPTSCSCDPFSVVFNVGGPENDPPRTGCNCPEAGGGLTVTISTTPC